MATDNTCECCRLGLAFAGPGRPVVVFRNIFEGGVRDHAVMTFADPATPGEVRRVSKDDWQIAACPHHGPSLSISAAGAYHVTWYTNGKARKGLFYARSEDEGRTFLRTTCDRSRGSQSHAAIRPCWPARYHHGVEGVRWREDYRQCDDLA